MYEAPYDTEIHAGWITGPVPGDAYCDSGRPQKSIQQLSPYCNPTACSSL